MDEQRLQAYGDLIQELLRCPSGEANQILNQHLELVDEGLLQALVQVAQQYQSAGKENEADFLLNLAQQLAAYLNRTANPRTSFTATQPNATPEEYLGFLIEVLQATSESQGNPRVVYPLLQANLDKLDDNFAQVLRSWATETLGKVKPAQAQTIAIDVSDLSVLISNFSLGSRINNLEISITGCEIINTIFTREAFPQDWAITQNNLANAYSDRIRGDRTENLELAISAYEQALQVLTREAFPQDWAMTQYNLANAYRNRIRGDRVQNLELAISAYEQALQVRTREAFPQDWAMTQNNLANAYSDRIRGDRTENLELAISAYEQALQVLTREAFPKDWAMTQNNLALAYSNRIRGDRAQNLELAIAACQQALQVRTREAFPKDWAMTQNNLALAYSNRIRGDRAQNLELAIAACQQALQVLTREAFPKDWAMTQNNLALAYSNRIRGDRAQNLEFAISAYEQALQVRTREAFPQDWAMTQNNLALAYRNRIRGDRAQNLEFAISAYEQALQVLTCETFPQDWAMTQNNLAAAYSNRIRGDRAQNLELAIAACQQALQVRTREAFPQDWAMTQNNLANAYSDRIRGERAQNLELAIAAFQQALQVYTREAFPQAWAGTQNNLALTYSDRIQGDRAENLELAIAAFQQALQVYTREAFPQAWAMTQNNLALAYSDRIRGDRAENLELAIAACQKALRVYTHEAFPQAWAWLQNSLANAYLYRIREDRAQNLELAISAYEQALRVSTREAFPQAWAGLQNNLANAYFYRIRGDSAENLEQAISLNREALKILTREAFPKDWAMTQNNLANAYLYRIRGDRAKNLELAIAYYQQALQVRTRQAFPQNYAETLFHLGLAYQDSRQLPEAYNTFADAIDTVEFLRGEIVSGDESKQKLAEEWNKLYRRMVEVCLELGNYPEAIEYVERSKTRNLVERLAIRDLYPKGEIPLEIRTRLQQLRQDIDQEKRRLAQDNNTDPTHLNQLRTQFNDLFPYQPLEFSQIQTLLDEKTPVLEWFISANCFHSFLLIPNSVIPRQSTPQDLETLVNWRNDYLEFYYATEAKTEAEAEEIKQQWRDSLSQRLESLAKILQIDNLLATLHQHFPTCKKLILVPHRYLHLFPLHALPVSLETWRRFHPEPTHPPEQPCVLDCFPQGVNYTPSCQLLSQVKENSGNFDRFFAIANPTENVIWADLEVETIRQAFTSENRTTLAGKNAKKSSILIPDRDSFKLRGELENAHCLYFSCHGSFEPDSPLDSGLLLADAVLTLEDILSHFNLSQCRLVTLSACETGMVNLDETDEYISLSSGFMLAGTPSLMVSQWSVDEVSTALLLIKAYENLISQPGKIALSLNQAQIWLRDTTVQDFLTWVDRSSLIPDLWRNNLQEIFQEMGNNKEQGWNFRPYQSPYHWATFCAVGKGEQ